MKKLNRRTLLSPKVLPTLIVLAAVIVLAFVPNFYENDVYGYYDRCKAEVLSVDNEGLTQAGLIVYGLQSCEVKLLDGDFKGEVYHATNLLEGKMESDKLFEPGDKALVLIGGTTDGTVVTEGGKPIVSMIDHYRFNYELIMVIGFALLLIIMARGIGARAILSFAFTILCIWKIMIPMYLSGYNAIAVGFLITAATSSAIIILVYGFNRRFIAAISGNLLGTGITAILAIIFVHLMNIHGAVIPYAESLLYAGYTNVDLTEIFIASIFVASSGALTDVAVDITSAINEVVTVHPNIGRKRAIHSGLNVGRAVLGTMATTLLLAYSGGYIGLLMVFVAQGTPVECILNYRFVSAEILHTMVGSFGLITVVPFTAFTAGLLLHDHPEPVDDDSLGFLEDEMEKELPPTKSPQSE